MASYTTNLNLKKPAGNENVAIGDINNNMEAIDQAYGAMESNISSMGKIKKLETSGSVTSFTLNLNSYDQHLIIISSNSGNNDYIGFVYTTSTGSVGKKDVIVGDNLTIDTSETNALIVAGTTSRTYRILDFCFNGNFVTL